MSEAHLEVHEVHRTFRAGATEVHALRGVSFTAALAMRDRVRLDLEADHIGVWPTARPDAAVPRADPDVGGDVDEQGEGRA